jgi:hypothetical protein
MKHVKLFESFVNEDIKIKSSISEETANKLLDFLKQAIGKTLNWKEFSKWHGGAAQLGSKTKAQEKFLEQNFMCEIMDVTMQYDEGRKKAVYMIAYTHNTPWYAEDDSDLKLYKDDSNYVPKGNSTKEFRYDEGNPARAHYEKQFDRFSDITKIGKFGI